MLAIILKPMIEPELNHSSPPLAQDCQHSFTAVWTVDTQLVNFCTCCLFSQPVADASILQERRRQVAAVLAEYEQALFKCRTKTSRREFEEAIAIKHQQLAHIDFVLGELQHQTILGQSFNIKHPLELNLERTIDIFVTLSRIQQKVPPNKSALGGEFYFQALLVQDRFFLRFLLLLPWSCPG